MNVLSKIYFKPTHQCQFHLLISLKHLFTHKGTQIFKTIYICTEGKLSVQDWEKCPKRIFFMSKTC